MGRKARKYGGDTPEISFSPPLQQKLSVCARYKPHTSSADLQEDFNHDCFNLDSEGTNAPRVKPDGHDSVT